MLQVKGFPPRVKVAVPYHKGKEDEEDTGDEESDEDKIPHHDTVSFTFRANVKDYLHIDNLKYEEQCNRL